MGAANYHFVSIIPAGGSTYLLHSMGAGGASVITKAELKGPIDVADVKVSSNDVTKLPVPIRVQQAEDWSLDLTLLNTPTVNAMLRACRGKQCAIKYRESVAAISDPDNPEAQFNAMSNNGGQMGGQVAGGVTTLDVTFAVSDGVAPVFDVTP